jgi:hypothetical protein
MKKELTEEDKKFIDEAKDLLAKAEPYILEYKKREEEHKKYKEKCAKEAYRWIKVGQIGVDAGICWIGDPCYLVSLPHTKDSEFEDLAATPEAPKEFGEDWGDFGEAVWRKEKELGQPAAQFNYDAGHPGLGVCLANTGYGDGIYDVFIKKNKEGRIMEAKVVFIEEE